MSADVGAGAGACVVTDGLIDLFLRRPANCSRSVGRSGGGDPDMGGVGNEAQAGENTGLDSESCGVNLDRSMLDLCFLKDEQRGKFGRRVGCIRLVLVLVLVFVLVRRLEAAEANALTSLVLNFHTESVYVDNAEPSLSA